MMAGKDSRIPKFKSLDELQAFLVEAFEGSNPESMLDAIGTGARAYGISEMAKNTGLRRENFYEKLSAKGNPGFKDVVRILSVMGLDLTVRARRRWSHHKHPDIGEIISELRSEGVTSLRELAKGLTERGVPTAQGFKAWTPIQVSRVLTRLGQSNTET